MTTQKDRVAEISTDTGTGVLFLAGSLVGYRTFSVAFGAGGNTEVYYGIVQDETGAWETGLGTYLGPSNAIRRDLPLASSNNGALVTFTTGDKVVYCTFPAESTLALRARRSADVPLTLTALSTTPALKLDSQTPAIWFHDSAPVGAADLGLAASNGSFRFGIADTAGNIGASSLLSIDAATGLVRATTILRGGNIYLGANPDGSASASLVSAITGQVLTLRAGLDTTGMIAFRNAGNVMVAAIDVPGDDVGQPYHLMTREKSDYRFLKLAGGPMAGNITTAHEIILEPSTTGQLRFVYPAGESGIGVLTYSDSTNFYLMLTDAGVGLTGSYNALRPFYINKSTGVVGMSNGLSLSAASKLTMANGGVVVGTGVASTPSDLSKALAIYGSTYGFSVTGGRLNHISGGAHVFMTGTTELLTMATAAVDADVPLNANIGLFIGQTGVVGHHLKLGVAAAGVGVTFDFGTDGGAVGDYHIVRFGRRATIGTHAGIYILAPGTTTAMSILRSDGLNKAGSLYLNASRSGVVVQGRVATDGVDNLGFQSAGTYSPFYIVDTLVARFDAAGTAIPASQTVMTYEKTEALYPKLVSGRVAIAEGGTAANDTAEARLNLGADNASNLTQGTIPYTRLGVGSNEELWVAGRIAAMSHNQVGTYAYLTRAPATDILWGSTHAGSSLRPAGVQQSDGAADVAWTSTTLSGQWRAMGFCDESSGDDATSTLFLRIS